MSRETNYYLARGRSLEAVERYQREALAHREHAKTLQTKLGATGVFTAGNAVCGFAFDPGTTLPEGLKWDKKYGKEGMAVPDGRIKAGKSLQKDMRAFPCPSTWDFNGWVLGNKSLYFLGPHASGRGMATGSVGFEQLGGDWVLLVPVADNGQTPTPLDAEPLARSAYWTRKEAVPA